MLKKKPADSAWTAQDDLQLMKGIVSSGFGTWALLIQDPDIWCFEGHSFKTLLDIKKHNFTKATGIKELAEISDESMTK